MAGTSSLGRLTLDLVLKAGAFTAGMTAAERQANKSLSAIEKRAYKFGETLGKGLKIGAAAATVALGALALAVGKAIDNADQIRDLSIRLGTSTETLSAFGYAASQTGTDLDALGRGMKILAKNAADAIKPTSEQARIFDALGISVTDVTGKLKDQSVLIPEIADAFKGMEDGTTKTALALALFGKSGTDMIEFLNQGSGGLKEFEDKARSLGIVIDSETAAAADEFNDIMGDLKAIVAGGALTVAKELLPALKDAATALAEMAHEGDLAKNIAAALNGVLQFGVGVMGEYNNAVERTSIALGVLATANEAMRQAATGGLLGQLSAIQKVNNAVKEGQAQLDDLIKRQNSPFRGVTASSDTTYGAGGGNVDAGKLNNALAGIGGGGSKKSSRGGKSDAEKEADKLKAAYDRMNESLTEQIGLFGVTGEAAKLRYELEHGELSKLTDAEKESLIVKAEKLDAMNLEKELQDAAAKAVRQETEAFEENQKAYKELISDMEFENSIIGLGNAAREKAIALRYAGVDAMSAEGQEISALIDKNIQLRESYGFIEDVKDGLSEMFADFASGAKSAKEAFGDFADELFKRALQFVADKAIDAMFDAFNGDGKIGGQDSNGGGMWANIFGAFAGAFGGGKAGGGSVLPGKFYRVNESGMEGLTVNGKDYLMTGSESGVVTPAHRMGGGGVSQNNKFIFAAPTSQRTQEQVAQRSAFELSRAQRRNG